MATGQPFFGEENIIGEVLVEGGRASRGRCFALVVAGDRVIKDDIHEGNLVIVRRSP